MAAPWLTRRGWLLTAGALCCGSPVRAQKSAQNCAASPSASATEQERHGVLLLLTMALVHDGWCIDRSRPELVAAYVEADPVRTFSDYLGHNIGALLVTPECEIACFALNRNISCDSTMEHAEARAVRAGTAMVNAVSHSASLATYRPPLRGDRLYTTLEPCAQCSGIMDLANLSSVIYLQDDPGTHDIVDLLYNLSCGSPGAGAPVPLRADFLPFRADLHSAYAAFRAGASAGTPIGPTAFLGSVAAYAIYRKAASAFDALTVRHPENRPVLAAAQAFRTKWRHRIPDGGAPDAVLACF